MANYVEIQASAIEAFLTEKGFTRTTKSNEVVYSRSHDKDPRVSVLVYTSIRVGKENVRACGKDSIKVCTVFTTPSKSFGIGRFPHIFRVGDETSVLDRMLGRMREAYKRGSEWIRENEIREQTRGIYKEVQTGGHYVTVQKTRTPLDGI